MSEDELAKRRKPKVTGPELTDVEKRRKLKNEDLVHRMREGESLALLPQTATFFPPRPIIKKDTKALRDLGFIKDTPGSDE